MSPILFQMLFLIARSGRSSEPSGWMEALFSFWFFLLSILEYLFGGLY